MRSRVNESDEEAPIWHLMHAKRLFDGRVFRLRVFRRDERRATVPARNKEEERSKNQGA
jgi:hypothetical protein